MGAAHSNQPRSVSIDNLTPGIIDVSDEVVDRISKGLRAQAKAAKKESPPPPPPPPQPAAPVQSPTAPTVVYQNAPPVYIQSGGHTMTAIDVQRQMENELKQSDAMWHARMAQLEETLKKTNAILEQEYTAAVEDVRKRFATAAPAHQLPPCQDCKAQLIACYRAHPGETLKCADEVASFRDCVSAHRIKKLDAEKDLKSGEKPSTSPATKPLAKAG